MRPVGGGSSLSPATSARSPDNIDGAPARDGASAPGNSWLLLLLFLGAVLNIFDRQVINILAEQIKGELAISDAQLGLLTGTAFGVFYAAVSVPLARLSDRFNRVYLISAAIALWSLFTAASGLASGFVQLFLARMGVGVGEAGSQPASAALIHDAFPERTRTTALSTLIVGQPAGTFLGFLVGGVLAGSYGWRAALIVAGAPGLLLALAFLLTIREPRNRGERATRVLPPLGATLLALTRAPGLLLTAVGMCCSAFLIYASNAWLPVLFIRVHHLPVAQAGAFAALAIGLGGAVGSLGSGALCDSLRGRFPRVESWLLISTVGLCFPALLTAALSANLGVALGATFLFNILAYAWQSPTVFLIQRASGEQGRALGLAAIMSLSSIASLGLGLPLVGLMSDLLKPSAGLAALGYALAVASLAGVIGMISHYLALRAMEARQT